MSYFTTEKLSYDLAYHRVLSPEAGAVVVFTGTARNHGQEGTGVVALEYEVKESLATKMLDKIIAQVAEKYGVIKCYVRHKTGRVELMESSVIIAVSCAHRKEAYLASNEIIDRIKHEVSIWKRAHFSDGHSEWSEGCQVCLVH